MTSENKGYSLTLLNQDNNKKVESVYLRPMSFYVPEIAMEAIEKLIDDLALTYESNKGFVLTVTNKNNGVSVDKRFPTLDVLKDNTITADVLKELVNIIRGYDSDEEANVCGW
ncbi:hypothetical protein ED28_09145 [[Pantoea] beijingensis]|uniref:DUF1869 domain-containing protein n=1 Tax=[Pantoea] beijingensis TaxID=1324864 RepID=A0A443IDF0_9GAMM|nr:DUF1869 domain-containing protein [[Pantoea] beijingensis]RWR02222.1 hypothetical protein ED28_09145 [[Pantoea] beijingensis]